MEIISDPPALKKMLGNGDILSHFETRPLEFRLFCYQKGELLTTPFRPLDNLLFVVRGRVKIYGLREDGGSFSISLGGRNAMLGDMEFVRKDFPAFYTEALEEVLCVALSIEGNRPALAQDSVFLWYLLECMSYKVRMFSLIGHSAQPVADKVLTFLREIQPDHTLHGISTGLMQFHCSRRQLQRVVKKLCSEGRLKKTGKGEYRLAEGALRRDMGEDRLWG